MRSFAINACRRRDTDNIATIPLAPAASPLWRTEFGRQILLLERRLLAQLTRSLHGDQVVWLGEDLASVNVLRRCMVRNATFMQITGQAAPSSLDVQGDESVEFPTFIGAPDELPIQSRSVDGFVLHHTLERVKDPRPVLREAQRVLAPGGRMVIVGFNPLSWFGLRRLYAKCRADEFSSHRMVNPLRLFDWLALLGLELERLPQYVDYGLPMARASRAHIRARAPQDSATAPLSVPFGGVLMVSAVKQALAGKPKWRRAERDAARLAPVAYPRVASWLKSDQ